MLVSQSMSWSFARLAFSNFNFLICIRFHSFNRKLSASAQILLQTRLARLTLPISNVANKVVTDKLGQRELANVAFQTNHVQHDAGTDLLARRS